MAPINIQNNSVSIERLDDAHKNKSKPRGCVRFIVLKVKAKNVWL